ncbi:RloB family protein [Amycolatopsis mongoliensis]|uniref:RloB family protein n=1 Tax=Amycolatopsis mongoliensis TaxID=715475 RepID=A0A9Y2NHT3_9PSEU|nr:RloB family protein [Amycolatopsis sp. 4-36]WIY05612.1 RloB family protein [Amycolatopsis sp. 4-36]
MSRRSNPHADKPLHKTKGASREHRVIYVAVEGERTEVDYLTYLKKDLLDSKRITLHVLAKRNGMKPLEAVDYVLAQAEDPRRDELWAMFDRDQHEGIPQAFDKASAKNVKIAYSSPSFDLWLLLHFTGFNSGRQSGSSTIVHEQLRRQRGFETFDIRGDKSVRGERVEALRDKHEIAARNAKKLANDCPTTTCSDQAGHDDDHCPPLRRDPCTDVWQLLVSLKIIDA